jgi:hypothetical protein
MSGQYDIITVSFRNRTFLLFKFFKDPESESKNNRTICIWIPDTYYRTQKGILLLKIHFQLKIIFKYSEVILNFLNFSEYSKIKESERHELTKNNVT